MAQPTNTQFALAVHVLTLLGIDPGTHHSSEFLAGSAGASAVHVRRVLGRLRRAGLVRSRPGPSGGWLVAGELCDTTLADVWRAVNGDDPCSACTARTRTARTGVAFTPRWSTSTAARRRRWSPSWRPPRSASSSARLGPESEREQVGGGGDRRRAHERQVDTAGQGRRRSR